MAYQRLREWSKKEKCTVMKSEIKSESDFSVSNILRLRFLPIFCRCILNLQEKKNISGKMSFYRNIACENCSSDKNLIFENRNPLFKPNFHMVLLLSYRLDPFDLFAISRLEIKM